MIEKDKKIQVANIKKTFVVGTNKIEVLRGVTFDVYEEDFMVIVGPSGCGKSTLLNVLVGLEKPTAGKIIFGSRDLYSLSEDSRAVLRLHEIGMVHQMSYWIKSLNVLENIALPLFIRGIKERYALDKAKEIMRSMDIESLSSQIPTQLSGGQQQCVNLARAVVTNPSLIIADEPTGNLDSTSSNQIMSRLNVLNKESKRTVILVTHNQAYWEMGTRKLEMRDGMVVKDSNALRVKSEKIKQSS